MSQPQNASLPSPTRHSGAAGWITATLRWTLIILSALAVGPIAASLLSHVHDVDGGRAISMLVSESIGSSVIGVIAILAAAAAVAALGAKVFSPTVAFPCAGLVAGWGAWRTGTLEEMIRRSRSGGEQITFAIENTIIVAIAVGIALLIARLSRRSTTSTTTTQSQTPATKPSLISWFGNVDRHGNLNNMLFASFASSAVAAGLAGYLGAATMAKGQAVFAALLAGIAAGVVAQMVSRSQSGNVTPALPIAAAIIPAIAAPLVAKFLHGDKIVAATFAGTVFPLARIMSLDWACGLLLGVPVGMGWAGAMIDEHAHK